MVIYSYCVSDVISSQPQSHQAPKVGSMTTGSLDCFTSPNNCKITILLILVILLFTLYFSNRVFLLLYIGCTHVYNSILQVFLLQWLYFCSSLLQEAQLLADFTTKT